MRGQFIEMGGRIVIDPKHISRVMWTEDLRQRFDQLYAKSGLSLRKIAKVADVGHSYVDKLRKETEFEAEYGLVLRILEAIGHRENALFDCPNIFRHTPAI